jgi:hypothetical protein
VDMAAIIIRTAILIVTRPAAVDRARGDLGPILHMLATLWLVAQFPGSAGDSDHRQCGGLIRIWDLGQNVKP